MHMIKKKGGVKREMSRSAQQTQFWLIYVWKMEPDTDTGNTERETGSGHVRGRREDHVCCKSLNETPTERC